MTGQMVFDAGVWRENWFRALSSDLKLFWIIVHSECDRAGWWSPDWDLVTARLKVELDPAKVLAAFGDQIKVHPSGWWELTYYQLMAYPKGLTVVATKDKRCNPMHLHVRDLMVKHFTRERRFGENLGMPPSTGGGGSAAEPAEDDEPGPTQGLPREPLETPQALKAKGEGPKVLGDGEGRRAEGVGSVQGGPGGNSETGSDILVEISAAQVKLVFRDAGVHDFPGWCEKPLRASIEAETGARVVDAAKAYIRGPGGPQGRNFNDFIRTMPQHLVKTCPHTAWAYWTAAADDYPMGMKVRMRRCENKKCRHTERVEGSEYQQEHEHQWGEVVKARGYVMDHAQGRLMPVDAYQRCKVCPEQRAAGKVAA